MAEIQILTIRIRVYIRPEQVRLALARANRDVSWLAKELSTSSGYLGAMMAGYKQAPPAIRERLIRVLQRRARLPNSDTNWDRFFRIQEVCG